MFRRALLSAALLFPTLQPAAPAAQPADAKATIDVGGVARTYVVHVPPQSPAHPPLVLAFHGHGGDGEGQRRLSNLDAFADRDGFIVVYPDGIDREWNDGRPESNNHADDLAFVDALVARFERENGVDPRRVFATGMSNGAVFTMFLACNRSERIAAIAPVAGGMPVADAPSCKPRRPMSVLQINGDADPVMPYAGGEIVIAGARRGRVLSAQATAAFWAQAAGCRSSGTTALAPVNPADGTHVAQTAYAGCADGIGVVFYTIQRGGHTWPGGPQYLPRFLIGTASDQLDASARIAAFFTAHPLP
jgi:polyhydroxybutyrate depolymerase